MSLSANGGDDQGEGIVNKTSDSTTAKTSQSSTSVMFEDERRASECIQELGRERQDHDYQPNDQALEELRGIYDKYLELPSLLDRGIATMMEQMTNAARPILIGLELPVPKNPTNEEDTSESMGSDTIFSQFHSSPLPQILSAIYALSKVRGRKRIQKFLSHQVADVEPVLKALFLLDRVQKNERKSSSVACNDTDIQQASSVDGGAKLWESVYTLWNWMGIIGKIPFDCVVVLDDQQISHFLQLAISHLSETGPIRDVAASCLACWLTRPDMEHSEFRRSFHDWSKDQMKSYLESRPPSSDSHRQQKNDATIFTVLGILQTIVTMLKVSTADRSVLLRSVEPYTPEILNLSNAQGASTNILLRKYMIKWWTRIGMLYLPPRVASWRYQRGGRVLQENQGNSTRQENTPSNEPAHYKENEDYFFLVPYQVEVAMGKIIGSLGDVSTAVRWSSAKGVGRITSRLPAICAEDVLDAILTLFDDKERDNDWHGACLALAEMARRGLLLPDRLREIVVKIVEAIHFDVPRRQTSVGVNVRDAACYTYWALARAYSPETLRPYVPQLGESIVIAFLFDREVNCRRAASAAFQEMVGRQGTQNFPHGIDVLTAADFFSLGNRKDAYTAIAYHVAQFEVYRTTMICHLFRVKLRHWDQDIRILAAESLHCLSRRDPLFMSGSVLPFLVESCLDPDDVQLRHGSVLGVAEIVRAFGHMELVETHINGTLLQSIIESVQNIEKRRLFRGKGGELMREAVCRLIECISTAELSLSVPQQVRMLDTIDACLPHPNERIQAFAGKALCELMRVYFPVSSRGPSERLQNRVVTKYTKVVRTSINPAATRGFALALGYLPAKVLAPTSEILDLSLSCLCIASNPTARVGTEKDAETRCNALASLLRISETLLLYTSESSEPVVAVTEKQLKLIFKAFCRSMEDYNRDQRGDIGSKCRMIAMEGLFRLAVLICRSQHVDIGFLTQERCLQIVGLALKQFAEKLDSVRSVAAKCLIGCLDPSSPMKASLPQRERLITALALQSDSVDSVNWADAAVTFPLVMNVADIEEYFSFVVSGIIVSVGGLTKSVSQSSSAELLQWCRASSEEQINRLGIGKLFVEGLDW